jgi:hypothetical protein
MKKRTYFEDDALYGIAHRKNLTQLLVVPIIKDLRNMRKPREGARSVIECNKNAFKVFIKLPK